MLTHYIIVRRDLPLGVIAAMVCHAAGESAVLYQDPYDGRFRGATAVVLEAKDERWLNDYAEYLRQHDIQNVEVHESGGPFNGQFMAIGIVPCDREKIAKRLEHLQVLKVSTYLDKVETNE